MGAAGTRTLAFDGSMSSDPDGTIKQGAGISATAATAKGPTRCTLMPRPATTRPRSPSPTMRGWKTASPSPLPSHRHPIPKVGESQPRHPAGHFRTVGPRQLRPPRHRDRLQRAGCALAAGVAAGALRRDSHSDGAGPPDARTTARRQAAIKLPQRQADSDQATPPPRPGCHALRLRSCFRTDTGCENHTPDDRAKRPR